MPRPNSLDEAVDLYQRANPQLDRRAILDDIYQRYQAQDVAVTSIPDIGRAFEDESIKAEYTNAIAGVMSTLGQVGKGVGGVLGFGAQPGSKRAEMAGLLDPTEAIKQGTERTMSAPWSRTAGEVAGGTVAAENIPGMAGGGLPWRMAKQALAQGGAAEMGLYGPDVNPVVAAGIGAAGPAAVEGVGRVLPWAAGKLQGAREMLPETRGARIMRRMAQPAMTAESGPVELGAGRAIRPQAQEPQREYLGTSAARTGQPFSGSFGEVGKPVNGIQMLADPRHPRIKNFEGTIGGKVVPKSAVNFAKPLVVDVGTAAPKEAVVEAARAVHANDQASLNILDQAGAIRGTTARNLLAKHAAEGGHDAVVINTPDPTSNLIFDLRRYNPAQAGPKAVGRQAPAVPSLEEASARLAKNQSRLATEATKLHASGDPALAAKAMMQDAAAETLSANTPYLNKETPNAMTGWLPPSTMSRHPAYVRFQEIVTGEEDRLMNAEYNRLAVAVGRMVKDGLKPEMYDRVVRAINGLEYDEYGKLAQTFKNVSLEEQRWAVRWKTEIDDELHRHVFGNHPMVQYELERFGLGHNRRQFERLRDIQVLGEDAFNLAQAGLKRRGKEASQAEVIVAERLKGKLGFAAWHDLDAVPNEGFFRHNPVANERAVLEDTLKGLKELEATGKTTTAGGQDVQQQLVEHINRLKAIEDKVRADMERGLPSQDFIPKKQFYGPMAVVDNRWAKPLYYDKDIVQVSNSYIAGALNKAFNDRMLYEAKQLLGREDYSPALKQTIADYANIMRGSRGYRGDAVLARRWQPLFKKWFDHDLTAQDVHRVTSYVMRWQLDSKLFLSPIRFPIINMSHLLVTLYPVVGEGTFGSAVKAVLSDPEKWYGSAAKAGIISPESFWWHEIGDGATAKAPGGIRSAFHTLSTWTEHFRRTVAWAAGHIQAEKGEFSSLVRTFAKDAPGRTTAQTADAYARALVDLTQFRLSVAGRPTMFTGSPWRRLAFQFKTWPSNLLALYGDMIRQKNGPALLRTMGALAVFGGLPALTPGGPMLFNLLRAIGLRHGVDIPDKTGLQYGLEHAGLAGSPLSEVDILSLRDPVALFPPKPTSLAGPFMGSGLDLIYGTVQNLEDDRKQALMSGLMNFISPQGHAMIQGAVEAYKGAVTGKGGEVESVRPWLAPLLRGLDVTPSPRGERYKYQQDIANAVQSGNEALVERLADEAQSRGIILDRKFKRRVMGIVRSRMREADLPGEDWLQ